MSKPNPHNSSLLKNSRLLAEAPYCEWVQLARTEKEFLHLLRVLPGIPSSWITWVEHQVQTGENRGVIIKEPINYRLSVLWQGVILLQENKYITDIVENALRQSFINHTNEYEITYAEMKSISNWGKTKNKYEEEHGLLDVNSFIGIDFISMLCFGDLIQTFSSNWDNVKNLRPVKPGLATLFWNSFGCRDKNLFLDNMQQIKKNRNKIAHSNKLFTPHETLHLYRLANIWMEPLGIDIKLRIESYRDKRPNFLDIINRRN